jgi:hypothetical protein
MLLFENIDAGGSITPPAGSDTGIENFAYGLKSIDNTIVSTKWSKVKGATGYTVYYKTKSKGSWKKLKNVKGTSYTKTKLKSKATYFFTVKAYKKYKGVTYTGSFSSKKVKIK